MKRVIFVAVALLSAMMMATAQPASHKAKYEAFKASAIDEYNTFREQANAKYAAMLRDVWRVENSVESIELKSLPEPPEPTVAPPNAAPTNDVIEVEEVVSLPVVESPELMEAIPLVEVATRSKRVMKSAIPELWGFKFEYYGTPCRMNVDDSFKFKLSSVTEEGVADAWTLLSEDKYTSVVKASVEWKDTLELNDWGYLRFIESFTESFLGAKSRNEATVMQMFILIQSGYKVRIARCGEELTLLLPFKESICEYPFLRLGEEFYYIRNRDMKADTYAVFDKEFPNEKLLSIALTKEPKLMEESVAHRTIAANRYGEVAAEVATNKNLIDFYDDYPRTDSWNNYAYASLSSSVKEMLYPTLKQAIEGREPIVAANILLDLVQSGLEYKTDGDQFGAERPLFADESLYYPFCDCEDRSILYSILVRDLLGLDVVLLNYPLHLATAVAFKGSHEGDYITVKGQRYLICDPTYIGADVGQSMPEFKNTVATVIRL
ncbi:MAG: hypothetical protein R3Y16_06610 [Rikenellaceae bacterium]